MYTVIKILAGISLVLHVALHLMTVTDWFNRVFIAIAILILLMPRKWWAMYIIPVILMLAGLIVGGYLMYVGRMA
ncbi:MAG: hypothetical protein GY751_00095 [Bacteroidetes bacterium]|nr:hypothetical protein [Bacteroidota bacterium]